MSTRQPRQSSEAELDAFDALCARLSGFGDAVMPEWADGFLTALVCGPVRPPPQRWLEMLAGDAFERAFADPPDREQGLRALAARIAVIEDELDVEALMQWPDEVRLFPLMTEVSDADRARLVASAGLTPEEAGEVRTGGLWAQGFVDGAMALEPDWGLQHVPSAARQAYVELTAQVSALLFAPGSEDESNFVSIFYPDGLPSRDDLVTEALFAVQDLRLWWLDHAPRPLTRRVQIQPGRNEPCPCGSGKKFKKCHGAGA